MKNLTTGGNKNNVIFYKQSDISNITVIKNIAELNIRKDAEPYILTCARDTVEYNCSEDNIDGEIFYRAVMKAEVNKKNKLNDNFLTEIKNQNLIAFFTTKEDETILLGDLFTPIYLRIEEEVTKTHDFNGYRLEISYNGIDRPYLM